MKAATQITVLLLAASALAAAVFFFATATDRAPTTTTPPALAGKNDTDGKGNALSPHHPAGNGQKLAVPEGAFSHFQVGNRNVKSLYMEDGLIWIGTSGGVIRYDTATEDYKVFDNRVEGILSNGIFHINKIAGRIIVGTYGGGMSVFNPDTERWRNFNIPDGLADQFVYGTLLARNGDLWIATWSGVNRVRGAELENPAKWETYTVENTRGGLPNDWVYALDEGVDGTLWFGTEGGLASYRDGVWRNWKHEDGLGADYEAVREANRSTSDPGAASSHHARQKAEMGLDNVDVAYNPNYIISLAVDRNGVVWCGTWGGGLARFDGSSWRNYTTVDGLPANHIFMLRLDAQGRLWAGTNRGLARLRTTGKAFAVMSAVDGLYSDSVFSMAFGADGGAWIGSFGGVAQFPRLPQEIMANP